MDLGAKPINIPTGPIELNLPTTKGIGGAPVYLIDRYQDGQSIHDINSEIISNAPSHPTGGNFAAIDHMTHKVLRGHIRYCDYYYKKLFGFREIRYFDIRGEYTRLKSRALTPPNGQIRIPLNAEASVGTGQIKEFLIAFNSEGIQHIVLATKNLLESWYLLKASGVNFMTPPPKPIIKYPLTRPWGTH